MRKVWNRWGRVVRITFAATLLAVQVATGTAAATVEPVRNPTVQTAAVQKLANEPMLLSAGGTVVTEKVNVMGDFIADLVTALGAIVTLFGLVSFAKSFIAHDPGDRPRSLEFIVGGLIFAFAPQIIKMLI